MTSDRPAMAPAVWTSEVSIGGQCPIHYQPLGTCCAPGVRFVSPHESDLTSSTPAAKVEYRAACADGSTGTASVHRTPADAVRHGEAMDSNPKCSPHRVQRRTVTYGDWSDV